MFYISMYIDLYYMCCRINPSETGEARLAWRGESEAQGASEEARGRQKRGARGEMKARRRAQEKKLEAGESEARVERRKRGAGRERRSSRAAGGERKHTQL